jgi:hypothetical protein
MRSLSWLEQGSALLASLAAPNSGTCLPSLLPRGQVAGLLLESRLTGRWVSAMRKCYSILLAIVGVVAALGAEEFGKRKPVQEWTREGTLEFFRSSPWVRRALVKSGMPRSDSLPFSGSVFEGLTSSGGACLSCAHIEPQRERPSGAGSGSESGVGIPGRVGGVISFSGPRPRSSAKGMLTCARSKDGGLKKR